MDAKTTNHHSLYDVNSDYTIAKEDKFELMNCSLNGVHCSTVLPEINKLYAESEVYRVNKEYVRAAELLEQAYNKTFELKKTSCATCVDFFQTSIAKTMETMQEEVHQMSLGLFHKKRYEQVYLKLRGFLKNMNLFNIRDSGIFTTNKSMPASADL